jgi:hypothetical protein
LGQRHKRRAESALQQAEADNLLDILGKTAQH